MMSNPLQTKEHYDPRIGDEGVSTRRSDTPDKAQSSPIPSSVRPSPEQEANLYSIKGKESATGAKSHQGAPSSHFGFELPDCLRWIPDNWNLSKWMPAIRCAVAEWISLVLLVVKPSTQAMGHAAFLVLVGTSPTSQSEGIFVDCSLSAGMLSPPGDPFVTNTERELIVLLSVLVAWGLVRDRIGMHTCSVRYRSITFNLTHRWASLGIKLSSLARTHTDYTASISEVLSGKYIEAAVSIMAHLRGFFKYRVIAFYRECHVSFLGFRIFLVHQGTSRSWSLCICDYSSLHLSRHVFSLSRERS
jgi:hypothetical protein